MTVTEAADEYVLSAEAARALLAGAPWKRMVTLGDSVAEGIREAVTGYQDLSWADRIERTLREIHPDLVALNLGKRDLVTAEVRETQLADALAFEPDLAFVICGGNDFLRPGFDLDAVRRDLTAIVSALRDQRSDVVTFGMFDIAEAGLVPEKYAKSVSAATRALARLTEEIAREYGAVYVHFTDHPLGSDLSIYSSDRLHLNARGHAFAASEKVKALGRHLENKQN
ncbi:SGNH/GDSL hydrolase family protein [Nocardia sp. BMG51109]|uniref:SGNH/GDSL hydrolase family protein n=1 Tax=Nocardia sp. BMG51109 TaxID=1056816 RepID=UPI000463C2C2|nr:SGNH/GDSL hydrolase family protein [Nocardia sp. BMG51109]